MNRANRRQFLGGLAMTAGAAALSPDADLLAHSPQSELGRETLDPASPQLQGHAIDFRYSPRTWQTAFCFPIDPYKSLVGERGELKYGFIRKCGIYCFSETIEFSLLGCEPDTIASQELEAPAIPIVHTRIDRAEAFLELTTFASNRPEEGRVDNVVMEIRPRIQHGIHAVPLISLRTKSKPIIRELGKASAVTLDIETASPFMIVDSTLSRGEGMGVGQQFLLPTAFATSDRPARYFFRFPQEGQPFEKLRAGLSEPSRLLFEVRDFWRNWLPCRGKVSARLPDRLGEFWTACSRNILQACEIKKGKANLQVGPTVYRNLFVVDGHFLIEAARFLGYDAEAQQGLEATWDRQEASGAVIAGAGREHWKDTGIAIFTLVRQAELTQDWTYFRKMQPQVLQAVSYLKSLREKAKAEGSVNGRYGLLAQGFGDGGLGTIASEFTNTLWVLAALKAAVEASERLGISGFEDTKQFYTDLRQCFFAAAKQEMRTHPAGFDFLPMLVKEDPQWALEEWSQPRPQAAQWALSHTIYPGRLFAKDDPIVKGYIALMQACTQEEIPAETGWLSHEGVWNYDAAFAAHVYLWAGLSDWARRTFIGFLNHASPLYCWREEQPTRGSLNADYNGDMPHNWASAMCILYLRNILALEDGSSLRLLAGIGDGELTSREPFEIAQSPTRFGRVSLRLTAMDSRQGWKLAFERGKGPEPASIEIPAILGTGHRFSEVTGAAFTRQGDSILVAPGASSWQATWKS
jgi:hypothetical protein